VVTKWLADDDDGARDLHKLAGMGPGELLTLLVDGVALVLSFGAEFSSIRTQAYPTRRRWVVCTR
jgi:hypothetical protein